MSVYLPASKTLFHKGAAETVLESCTQYLTIDGTKKPLTQEKRTEFEQLIRSYAKDALRCVALSHKSNLTLSSTDINIHDHENELCLDAIVGIMDPLRPDVKEAVKTCQEAGIIVRMVSVLPKRNRYHPHLHFRKLKCTKCSQNQDGRTVLHDLTTSEKMVP